MTVRFTIVEEHRFVDELAEIEQDARRTDEAVAFVKELLARDPQAGQATANRRIFRLPIILQLPDSTAWKAASVFYVVRPPSVHLISIRLDH